MINDCSEGEQEADRHLRAADLDGGRGEVGKALCRNAVDEGRRRQRICFPDSLSKDTRSMSYMGQRVFPTSPVTYVWGRY